MNRINSEWTAADHAWLTEMKARHRFRTWPELIQRSAKLYDAIACAAGRGAKVTLEWKDGTKETLTIL